ncbi:glycan biosynthesis hexose transferase WsfD [Catenuloplanes japonicus]|uniref:glycan biosynthesis hexose transferase WsfD n=1 Tax=Catenuloplanes japonicus TaxID=33876 RepID=UPI000524413D|nr:hypothetical protein [Catenuloplanes japonicus]
MSDHFTTTGRHAGHRGESMYIDARPPTLHHRTREPRRRPAGLVFAGLAAAATTVLLARLFAGGPIGLSDQGDGNRLLCSLGLRQGNPYNSSTTDYLYLIWYDHTWYGEDCGATGTGEPYHSTQLWLAWPAKWLTHALTATDGLDLRVLGVICALLTGLAIAAVAMAVPLRTVGRSVVAGALTLIMADGTFAGYLISAYSEPAGFVGLLALVAGVLLYLRHPRWWGLLLVAGAAAFTIGAKTQTVSLLASVVPLLLLVRGPPVIGRLVVSIALCAGTATYLGAQPERFTVQNDYTAVFVEMLPNSPDAAADLRRLGLPERWTSSAGLPVNATGSAAYDPEFYTFSAHAGLADRLGVYAADPSRLFGMLGRGLDGMGKLRAIYVFSYPESAGRGPEATECRVCVIQILWKNTFGKAAALLVAAVLACAAICAFGAVSADRRRRAAGGTGLFLASAVIAQFWAVMLTEGASDLLKHMVFANLLCLILFVVTGAALATFREPVERDPDLTYARAFGHNYGRDLRT